MCVMGPSFHQRCAYIDRVEPRLLHEHNVIILYRHVLSVTASGGA
jgi:hypothetical protein